MCNSLFNYTWSCGYGLHYLVAIFAEFDMDSLLLFPPHLRRSFRLVINQSVGSSGVEFTPRDQSCPFVDCFLRLSLLLSTLYNKHYYLISPLFCSYMWELILKTHIWCASGFVLKTGCYNARVSQSNLTLCHGLILINHSSQIESQGFMNLVFAISPLMSALSTPTHE